MHAVISSLSPWWLWPALLSGDIAVDRALASWGLLALLLFVACVIAAMRWRYRRRQAADHRQLDRLYGLTERALIAADQDELLRAVAENAARLCRATHAAVLLADVDGRHLTYAAASDPSLRGSISISAISGPVTCFRSREVTEVPDASNCPFVDKDAVRKRGQRAALYAPILAGESCLGVLEVEDRKRRRSFSEAERFRVEYAGRVAGLGLRVADQRAVREQMHRSEKLSAIMELANAMAQELQSPIEAIEEAASSASRTRSLHDLEDRLDVVATQINSLSASIQRVVRFANPSSEQREEVDLNALLRRVVGDVRRRPDGREVQIKLGLSKKTPVVHADPTHLTQVFQILLRHAIVFLDRINGRALQIHTAGRDGRVVVSIAPIMRTEQAIRSSLASAKDGSSASSQTLGLSICQSLIERAGGALQVDQSSSLGFRIEIEYPLGGGWEAPAAAQHPPDKVLRLSAGPLTALVADPDESVQRALVDALAEHGYRAVPVSSGVEALAVASHMAFDWIFCDLRLQPVTALELYQKLGAQAERFVFLTDDAELTDTQTGIVGEGRSTLRKPFKQADVEALIESILRSSNVLQDA